MKNKGWIVNGILVFGVILCGCDSNKIPQGKFTKEQMRSIPFPPRYDLPIPSGGMSLNVDSDTITTREMSILLESQLKPVAQKGNFQAFKQAARPAFREALQSRITDIQLYREAKKKSPDTVDDALDKAVEAELTRFLASFDNNRVMAEQTLRAMGYDWKTYRDFQRRLILTQSYLSKEFKDKRLVSRSEIKEYYEQHRQQQYCWQGELQFRLIDLEASKLSSELIKEGETPETATVRLSLEILEKLRAGEDIERLAEAYSQGPKVSTKVTIGANSLQYEILEQTALAMDPNQIAGPLSAEGHLFIMKLENKKEAGCKSLEEVQDIIEQQFQFEFRKEQYQKVINRLSAHIDILQMEQFLDHCVIDAYAMWTPNQ